MSLTVGSLFSGIGGLDLGLERAGMTVRWQSEIDPYACRVLAKHWPTTPNLGDVTKIDWSSVEPVDLICGGYPCQPFSLAGARQGATDPRHLWPYFADALRHLRPRFALLENVAGHLSLGFGRVLGDLAEIGYDAEWDCVPAAAVGAPHRRDRVFVVAYPSSELGRDEPVIVAGGSGQTVARDDGPQGAVADTDVERLEGRRLPEGQGRQAVRHAARGREEVADIASERLHRRGRGDRRASIWSQGASQPARSGWWRAEPAMGRVVDGVPPRLVRDELRTLGNAVVPQVAEHVGRLILEAAA